MSIDIDKLEALAKAATPGGFKLMTEEDYEKDGDLVEFGTPVGYVLASDSYELRDDEDMDNAKFLEAANPSAILALITCLRGAEQRERELAAHLESIKSILSQGVDVVERSGDLAWSICPDQVEALGSCEPDISLSHLIAEKQAEALESINAHDLSRLAKSMGKDAWDMNPKGVAKLVNAMGAKLRQQKGLMR